jgi:hypothetical protein
MRLEIEAPQAGSVVRRATTVCEGCQPTKPIAPASDPAIGHPVELSLEDQGPVANEPAAGIRAPVSAGTTRGGLRALTPGPRHPACHAVKKLEAPEGEVLS